MCDSKNNSRKVNIILHVNETWVFFFFFGGGTNKPNTHNIENRHILDDIQPITKIKKTYKDDMNKLKTLKNNNHKKTRAFKSLNFYFFIHFL